MQVGAEFGNYVPCWKYGAPERETQMLHATWAGELLGRPIWAVGWRGGTRRTVAIRYQDGEYRAETIDASAGCANLMGFVNSRGGEALVAANREIDEVAMYSFGSCSVLPVRTRSDRA